MTGIFTSDIELPADYEDTNEKPIVIEVNSRPKLYKRQNPSKRFKNFQHVYYYPDLVSPNGSRSAALTYSTILGQNQETILTIEQLRQCADVWVNCGEIRQVINKHLDFTLNDRTKFMIALNDELTEGATDDELTKYQDILNSSETKELRRKILRINKRVKLHQNLIKHVTLNYIFGRGFTQIHRFPKDQEWTIFGEPKSLQPLNNTRVVDVKVNSATGAFEGIYYDFGVVGKEKILIPSSQLISSWFDDVNLYDNTLYSGVSQLWAILNVAFSNQNINDEDLPESTKQLWAKFGFVYAGTGKQAVTQQIKKQLATATMLVHNQEKLKMEVADLGRDMRELTDVRKANVIYICQVLGLPPFFMNDEIPNHATALASLHAYKIGTMKRTQTWIRGFVEDYFYDPILADHLNIPIEDVISADIKVKATFEDTIFETYKERIDALIALKHAGVYDDQKILEELGADDVLERYQQMQKIMERKAVEDAKIWNEQINPNGQPPQQNNNTPFAAATPNKTRKTNGFNRFK